MPHQEISWSCSRIAGPKATPLALSMKTISPLLIEGCDSGHLNPDIAKSPLWRHQVDVDMVDRTFSSHIWNVGKSEWPLKIHLKGTKLRPLEDTWSLLLQLRHAKHTYAPFPTPHLPFTVGLSHVLFFRSSVRHQNVENPWCTLTTD